KPRPAAARRPVPRTEPWRACAGARALPHAPRFAAPTLVRPRSPFTGQSPLRRGGADRTYCRLPTERRVAGRDVLAHAAYAVNELGGATRRTLALLWNAYLRPAGICDHGDDHPRRGPIRGGPVLFGGDNAHGTSMMTAVGPFLRARTSATIVRLVSTNPPARQATPSRASSWM